MPKDKAPANGATEAAALIIFGLDEQQKPHASWFAAAEVDPALRAAALMEMRALRVETDEHRALASQLPAGRVFQSGRAFVPFCAAAKFAALEGQQGAFVPPPILGHRPLPAIAGVPQTWGDIEAGSVVLVNAGPLSGHPGWFEAVVVEARPDDAFELRWRDWPDEPSFEQRREQLGLLRAEAA